MICEECKKDRVLHSYDIPLCEECFEDMFVLKHDVAETIQFEQSKSITLLTTNDKGTHTLVFSENGDLFLNGRLLDTDKAITDGMRSFLVNAGTLTVPEA